MGEEYDIYFEDDEFKELAYILVSYFEDYISDIGIWKVLVKKHKTLYNTPVPIYLKNDSGYDYESINEADICLYYLEFLHAEVLLR